MNNIGFIGTGIMGNPMVLNLMKNKFKVFIYTRTKSKAENLINQGAIWCESISKCVKNAQAVITMVGYPSDVKAVYFNKDGILNNARAGAYLIDMTTSDPDLSVKIYTAAKKQNMHALDAPVSGGDTGAKNASLSIMAGGDKAAFNACLPIFNALGTTILYQGPPGFGQHTKIANQIAISGIISSVCETITYSKAVGLDLNTMLKSISGGAASSFQLLTMAPKIINNDYDPGFFIKHFIKDLKIAEKNMSNLNISLDVLSTVLKMYKTLEDKNLDWLGTQGLIKYYEK